MPNPTVEHLFDEPPAEPLRSAKHKYPVKMNATLTEPRVLTADELQAIADKNPELAEFATPCIRPQDFEGFCLKVRDLRAQIHTLPKEETQMKAIALTNNLTVKDITAFLSAMDPDTPIKTHGLVNLVPSQSTAGTPELAVYNGAVTGMITDELYGQYGLDFTDGEHEHPLFKGTVVYENDSTDNAIVLENLGDKPLTDGDKFTIVAVDIPIEWDVYSDIVYLVYRGNDETNPYAFLIGYILDSDDAEDTYCAGPNVDRTNCFGIIRRAVLEEGLTRAPVFTTSNYAELLIATFCYSCAAGTDFHMYLSLDGITDATGLNTIIETVTIRDEDGEDDDILIGYIVDGNGIVRMVYLADNEYLEQAIANSAALRITGDGKYLFDEQKFLSHKIDGRFMPPDYYEHEIDGNYNRSTFVGAAAELVDIIDSAYPGDEDDDDDFDEDEGDNCPYPERHCYECDLLGSNECPNCAEDLDDDD